MAYNNVYLLVSIVMTPDPLPTTNIVPLTEAVIRTGLVDNPTVFETLYPETVSSNETVNLDTFRQGPELYETEPVTILKRTLL
ncbi:MAG: hypothetical protein WC184_11240 [Acidimicrobiia bacterium]